ncbi:unnamed protein product [Gordionus sp. m RMFG-2023]
MSNSPKFNIPSHLLKKLESRQGDKLKARQLSKTSKSESIDKLENLKRGITDQLLSLKNAGSGSEILNGSLSKLADDIKLFYGMIDENSNLFSNYQIISYRKFITQITKELDVINILPLDLKLDTIDAAINPSSLYRDSSNTIDDSSLILMKIDPKSQELCDKKPVVLKNLENVVINLDQNQTRNVNLIVENIKNCQIFIFHTIPNLKLSNIRNCTIKTGPILTSAFIEDCYDSEIYLISRQLRIHSSKSSKLHVLVANRIVMEDCSELEFSRYNLDYEELKDQLKCSSIIIDGCDWKKIDDFSWANPFQPSPNFTIAQI